MRKIPLELKEEMANDIFYKKCCITNQSNEKIDWHHNLIFKGQQVNEKFCILPLLNSIHRDIVKYKEKCDWIMWNRATPEQIQKYSKAINYQEVLNRLNKKYGAYNHKR